MPHASRRRQIRDRNKSGVKSPRLPHERDESSDSQTAPIQPVIEQAQKDIAEGKQDTDLHGTPGLDKSRK
ncbi:MAG TPA: hypothetical protein VFW00_00650 [Rhodocyclaceae bacterium]|nr:hypothetical protein [Rhodocyclaceae bacterium]